MTPSARHEHRPDVRFDGGDLDCGSGLLLLIRKHIDPLSRGQLLGIRSTEISVDEELPAWCRLTGNELISWTKTGKQRSFLVCKGRLVEREIGDRTPRIAQAAAAIAPVGRQPPRAARPALPIAPLAVMGIGSWPRPRWMIEAMYAHVEGRLDEPAFHETANDAVRLDNCQLIPLTDLLPLVDDPEECKQELRALDVPASEIRHPAVFGRLSRTRPLVAHEVDFAQTVTTKPVKVALPGPYLLTHTIWMECISDRAYQTREALAEDVVRVLRQEIAELVDAGASLIQLDEPVLCEVVFSGAKNRRSFMCGALSESRGPEHELGFARELVNAAIEGAPRERIALHLCRGNWTPDESVALMGGYEPLIDTLR